MTTHQPTILNLEIHSPQTVGFGGMTSAELIAGLRPEQKIELQAREAAARKKLAEKKQKEKEARENASNLPLAVAKQESEAIAYFKDKEPASIQVVEHIKKLRAEGKINYTELGNGKYAVTMPFGNKKLKMFFPPDTSLADTKYNWDNWTGKFTEPAISRTRLWSNDGQKYLKQKEKEGEKLLLKADFEKLIDGLYPKGDDQEKILAFMIATGFYGRLAFADRDGDNYQRAVLCYRISDLRLLLSMGGDKNECSLVHRTFLG